MAALRRRRAPPGPRHLRRARLRALPPRARGPAQPLPRSRGWARGEEARERASHHEFRLHRAHWGLPVLGDTVSRAARGGPPLAVPRQMLHARRLAFAHPVTGAAVAAESPLPPDFRAV